MATPRRRTHRSGLAPWIDRAAELYRAGKTLRAVAVELGIDPMTLRRHLLAAGVPTRSKDQAAGARRERRLAAADAAWGEEAETLYRDLWSVADIAVRVKSPEKYVADVLRRRGVKIRNMQAASRANRRAGAHLVGTGRPATALAPRTLATYQQRFRIYERWCQSQALEPYPQERQTALDTAQRFAAGSLAAGRSRRWITQVLVAVRHFYTEHGYPLPEALPAVLGVTR
jgi:hypothetical protein